MIRKKVDYITQDSSKPYFNNSLKKLALDNQENASILCGYIKAEQTEINIKESTKVGKIKVLIWLPNYFETSHLDIDKAGHP